jgi:hypothetical protein
MRCNSHGLTSFVPHDFEYPMHREHGQGEVSWRPFNISSLALLISGPQPSDWWDHLVRFWNPVFGTILAYDRLQLQYVNIFFMNGTIPRAKSEKITDSTAITSKGFFPLAYPSDIFESTSQLQGVSYRYLRLKLMQDFPRIASREARLQPRRTCVVPWWQYALVASHT